MCRLIALTILSTILVALLAVVLLFVFLPPGTALFVLFILALLLSLSARWVVPFLARWSARRFAARLVGMKSAPLRGAKVTVHSIEQLATPAHPELEVEALDHDRDPATPDIDILTPHDYYALELTITPAAGGAAQAPAMSYWEPSELRLAPVGARMDLRGADVWQVDRVERIQNGERMPEGIGPCAGPQRLRLYVSLPHDAPRSVTLHYYTESLASVQLPPRI